MFFLKPTSKPTKKEGHKNKLMKGLSRKGNFQLITAFTAKKCGITSWTRKDVNEPLPTGHHTHGDGEIA